MADKNCVIWVVEAYGITDSMFSPTGMTAETQAGGLVLVELEAKKELRPPLRLVAYVREKPKPYILRNLFWYFREGIKGGFEVINFLLGIIIGAIVWECARYGSRWILYFKEKWVCEAKSKYDPLNPYENAQRFHNIYNITGTSPYGLTRTLVGTWVLPPSQEPVEGVEE